MKIALINENSQNSKNPMIEAALKKVVEPMGHTVFNYGMYADADSKPLTYVQNGILAAVLLNSGAADYVVTGCGTGEGAMLACNSFPGVLCGHVADPLDAYTFAQVNDGNAVAMPFALKNGWGQELNLEYTFEKLFGFGSGNGYPAERVEPEQRNKKILDGVRAVTMRPLVDVLGEIDQDLVKGALAGEHFQEYFFANATDEAIITMVMEILGRKSHDYLQLTHAAVVPRTGRPPLFAIYRLTPRGQAPCTKGLTRARRQSCSRRRWRRGCCRTCWHRPTRGW